MANQAWKERRTVVFLSDFGTSDGAVSAMHGVADGISNTLRLDDLTHDIPQFNIWEASYRLAQALPYWAPGTVFVCVVDPGVGSDRKSIVALTESGHLVVTLTMGRSPMWPIESG
jgi:S-adenosylmethionine hydrolase